MSRAIKSCVPPLILLFAIVYPAVPDFWSLGSKGQPETVKLVRKLPPVSARTGSTVHFQPEIAGHSIPPEVAVILREKIRTLLLNGKAGGIQLVDGPADTVIKCIVTEYEPKIIRPINRKLGLKNQRLQTWIGNIGASVQVLDRHEHPIDSANLKNHIENDFLVSEQEDKVAAVGDKKSSWRDKLASGLKVAQGGDKADMVNMAGGGQKVHDAMSSGDASGDKSGRPPTESEWRTALVEGLAAKVANRIVPVDQEFVAMLPSNKEFSQTRDLAKNARWGNVLEQTEQMHPLSGGNEGYRLYMLGLANEATAYQDADGADQAAELLNKASKYYDDAGKVKPDEREIFLAQIRVQDSLDHYLEIQHYLQTHPKLASPPPAQISKKNIGSSGTAAAPVGDPASEGNGEGNQALIDMVVNGLADTNVIDFIQQTKNPAFDVSSAGLIQLSRARVSPAVITAVQKRMQTLSASRRAQPAARRVPSAQPVQ